MSKYLEAIAKCIEADHEAMACMAEEFMGTDTPVYDEKGKRMTPQQVADRMRANGVAKVEEFKARLR